jgi:hypothetical protein
MEVVANIALGQDFECKLTGGFVRDWVVRGEVQRPATAKAPKDWVVKSAPGQYTKYEILEGVLPKDLDLELSSTKYFDAGRFVTQVRECGIEVNYMEHIAQRYVFLFERERGPFTADFIEPHFAALHTTADFDVNTLCVVNYPDLIGLKREYKNQEQERLNVDDVVANCLQKQLVQTKSGVADRLQKMQTRGWTLVKEVHYVPVNERVGYTVLPISRYSAEFERFKGRLAAMPKNPGKLVDMYEIQSGEMDALYKGMKDFLQNKNKGDPNEKEELFHGTKEDAVNAILRNGFDDKFWNAGGFFGRGAYFADDPNLSNAFTGPANPRTIFVCSVLMGKVDDRTGTPITAPMGETFNNTTLANGFDSVNGHIYYGNPPTRREKEYIVYRLGQARIKYMLRYNV